jgi:hypothetical protein
MSVGPFEAEVRGKEKEEDILTSRLFGILNRVDKVIVLGRILRKLGVDVPNEELRQAEIRLWEEHDGTIPDAVIETKSNLIFVECKLESPLIFEQLKRECHAGSKKGKDFHLLCITKHFMEPPEIREAKTRFPQIKWTSWQELNASLRRINELRQLDMTSKGLLNDLVKILNSKGLRGFAGFKEKEFKEITKGTNSMIAYFNEMSIFIRELCSQLDSSGIELKTRKGSWFHRDGRGTSLDRPDDWVTCHLTFAFGAKDWPFVDFWRSNYLFVRFYLLPEEDPVVFGYSIRAKGNEANIDALIEKRKEICSYLKSSKHIGLVFIRPWWECNYDVFSHDEIVPELFQRENLENVFRTEFCCVANNKEFSQRKLLTVVKDVLVELKDTVSKMDLLPKIEEEEETPQLE